MTTTLKTGWFRSTAARCIAGSDFGKVPELDLEHLVLGWMRAEERNDAVRHELVGERRCSACMDDQHALRLHIHGAQQAMLHNMLVSSLQCPSGKNVISTQSTSLSMPAQLGMGKPLPPTAHMAVTMRFSLILSIADEMSLTVDQQGIGSKALTKCFRERLLIIFGTLKM